MITTRPHDNKYFNPYETPYEAYISYMNVLSDFMIRVKDMNLREAASPANDNAKVTGIKKRKTGGGSAKSFITEDIGIGDSW